MKIIQNKKHQLKTYEIEKVSCHVLMIKDMRQMMEFIRQLIFIKIVLQAVKRLKNIVIKKKKIDKDCDKKEEVKKDCDFKNLHAK